MTLTSTYDHRIIQGAQSGDFLRRVHQLLLGEDGFYDDIFRVAADPLRADPLGAGHLGLATTTTSTRPPACRS